MLLCMTLLPGDTELGESRRNQDDQRWQLCGTVNDINGQIKQGKVPFVQNPEHQACADLREAGKQEKLHTLSTM